MDDRGRVPIPPRYRDLFANGGMLNQGPEPCLRLFTPEGFQLEAERIRSEPATDAAARMAWRRFFGSSCQVEVDKQGRILIPGRMRDYAGLEANILLVGVGDWLEIWNPQHHDVQMG